MENKIDLIDRAIKIVEKNIYIIIITTRAGFFLRLNILILLINLRLMLDIILNVFHLYSYSSPFHF